MPKVRKRVGRPKKIPRKQKSVVKIFEHDFYRHFMYTLFLLLISSLATSFVWAAFTQKPNPVTSLFLKNDVKKPLANGYKYEEKGSPFDIHINDKNSQVIFNGDRSKKRIALTFDAEMTDSMKAAVLSGKVSYDKRIIDILNRTQTKATLFLTGMWIELYPKETEEFSSNPLLELGSHSYTDSSYDGYCFGLTQLHNRVKIEEIGATEKLLREHGHIDNFLFRFPGGCYKPEDIKLVNQAGDIVVHWDVAAEDGFNENTDSIVKNVVSKTQNGSIIVMHMNGGPTAPKTADALPEIISQLRQKGFEFVKVNELLNSAPEPRG
ncbi:MAG: polysaccharide deacetylase family protein [Candidatus Levyibacteriota bacterium]